MSRFGVMFFNGPIAAFANIRRALRPGGRLAFACWGPLDANPWFRTPLEIGIRHLGPPEPLPPRAPGPLAFGEPDYVAEILGAAGLKGVAVREEHPTLRGLATAEDEAGLAMALGPTSRLIASKKPDPATLAAVAREIADAFRPNLTGGGMRVPSTVFIAEARAP
jgi:SAM-dependent methyltransferase